MRLDAVGPRHGADEPGFQERAPFVHQAAVSAVIVLSGEDAAVSRLVGKTAERTRSDTVRAESARLRLKVQANPRGRESGGAGGGTATQHV